MNFLMDLVVTPVEYMAYYVFGVAFLCFAGIAALLGMGITWATVDWIACLTYCAILGKTPPTWHSRFMALEGGSMGGL